MTGEGVSYVPLPMAKYPTKANFRQEGVVLAHSSGDRAQQSRRRGGRRLYGSRRVLLGLIKAWPSKTQSEPEVGTL